MIISYKNNICKTWIQLFGVVIPETANEKGTRIRLTTDLFESMQHS